MGHCGVLFCRRMAARYGRACNWKRTSDNIGCHSKCLSDRHHPSQSRQVLACNARVKLMALLRQSWLQWPQLPRARNSPLNAFGGIRLSKTELKCSPQLGCRNMLFALSNTIATALFAFSVFAKHQEGCHQGQRGHDAGMAPEQLGGLAAPSREPVGLCKHTISDHPGAN